MRLFPSTQSLASTAARHPWRTLAVWLVIILGAGYFASGIGDVTDDENSGVTGLVLLLALGGAMIVATTGSLLLARAARKE